MSTYAQKPRVRVVQPQVRVGDYIVHKRKNWSGPGIVLPAVRGKTPVLQGMVRVQLVGMNMPIQVFRSSLTIVDEREWAIYAASLALGVKP